MKTKSVWGAAPTRLYKFKNKLQETFGKNFRVCVVGASDGKFVMPFLRSGIFVTAYEIDEVAIYGGEKIFPLERVNVEKTDYIPHPDRNPPYRQVPAKMRQILGLKRRAEIEKSENLLTIREENFYKNPPDETYEGVFTSCSIPYPSNFEIPLEQIMCALKKTVKVGGYLYMDYMLPLEDRHNWRPEHYIRRGTIQKYFSEPAWKILHLKEQHRPIFEAAHVDRSEDHFHRFGFILVKHLSEESE